MKVPAEALDLSILELRRRIADRSLSPVALAEASLDRVGRLDPRLRAFVTVTPEVALAEARGAEAELRRGRSRGPLHGIPYGLKDNIDTRGIRTTWGARPYAGRVPDRDATVVERLREAGAVLLGKLSMVELAGGLGTTSAHASITGACRNPWDPLRWAGGSSSGPAAAVAAGLVGFALGTETSGSLLYPAALCGVTAFRPTYGVVSRAGVLPYAYSLDKLGPMARSAADCAAVLAAVAGRDRLDRSSVRAPRGLGRAEPRLARGLRVAVIDLPRRPHPVPPGMDRRFGDALGALERAGLKLEAASLPALPWLEVVDVIVEAEAEVAFEDLIRSGRVRDLADPSHRARAEGYHRAGRPSDYVKASVARSAMREAALEFFRGYDLAVSATIAAVAPLVDEPLPEVSGSHLSLMGNLLGLPAASVPMGFIGPGRLPVGLTIVGRPMEDAKVLAAAALYQSATAWHRERPPIATPG